MWACSSPPIAVTESKSAGTRILPSEVTSARVRVSLAFELRRPLLECRRDALGEVLGRQERRVPGGDVAQALGERRDALLVEDVLDAVDGQRGIGGDLGRGGVRGGQRGLGIVVDVVDKADLLRAGCVD